MMTATSSGWGADDWKRTSTGTDGKVLVRAAVWGGGDGFGALAATGGPEGASPAAYFFPLTKLPSEKRPIQTLPLANGIGALPGSFAILPFTDVFMPTGRDKGACAIGPSCWHGAPTGGQAPPLRRSQEKEKGYAENDDQQHVVVNAVFAKAAEITVGLVIVMQEVVFMRTSDKIRVVFAKRKAFSF